MRVIGVKDGVYVYAPRKREDTTTALDRISDIHKGDCITYTGITSSDDLRKNGYKDIVEALTDKIDFDRYNLIFVKIC